MPLVLRQRKTGAAWPRTDSTDEAIRSAIASGSPARAVELLRTAYGCAVYRFARRMLADDFAAEDVVQDTLMRAFVAMSSLRDDTSLRAWVMKIAAHRILDELRRRRRRHQHASTDELPELVDPRPLAGALLARRDDALALAASLDAMPARLRTSVILYFGQELTFAQVGAALGENGATTLVRVRRGLGRLRRQLRRHGVDATALAG